MMPTIWLNNAHASQREVAALIRQGAHGEIRVATSHKDSREDIFMCADESFVEPRFDTDADANPYVEWALEVVAERGISALLAMRHRMAMIGAAPQFAAAGVRLAAGATTMLALDVCEHKDVFTREVIAAGIPAPRTIPARTADELRAAIAQIELEGEACVKPVLGVYGRGYWRFQQNKSLFDLFSGKSLHEIDPEVFIEAYAGAEAPKPLIVMEHLPGEEHSIDCVCDAGRIVAHAKRKKVGTYQVISTGGPEVEIAEAVADLFKLDGLVNVQTRADQFGKPRVLEVNTRPSGGIGYAIAAGINLPLAAANLLLGRPVQAAAVVGETAVRVTEMPVKLPATTDWLNGPAVEVAA